MNLKIRKYNPTLDYENLMKLVQSEGEEWKDYLNPIYRKVLKNSITYVALIGEELCGYSRSLSDSGLFIWVIDLLVNKNRRGLSIGKRLMECILIDFPDIDVFVMSDVDPYYDKLGYEKEGSIFKVIRTHNKT
ncbi:MAG: GNAT family N-acetyltransferase [Balneolaceae bacterium]